MSSYSRMKRMSFERGETQNCEHCGMSFATLAGLRIHWTKMHGVSDHASRNWNICRDYEHGGSVETLMDIYGLGKTTIYKIIQTEASFPGVYDYVEKGL
jgi:Mor family transcriptional regulator